MRRTNSRGQGTGDKKQETKSRGQEAGRQRGGGDGRRKRSEESHILVAYGGSYSLGKT